MQRFYMMTIFLITSVFDCMSKQYVPVDTQSMKYVTNRQKKKLFKSVGSQYSNTMNIEFVDFSTIQPKQTDYYRSYSDQISRWSAKYHDDVVNHTLAPMYLAWVSPVVGYGVFASKNITKGDFIGVYAGQLRAVRELPDEKTEDVDYAWYYTIHAPNGKKLIIDGKYQGNELRFINHDNNPNTRRIDVLINGVFYVCYVASKNIPKDTQLTVSYGDGYWTSRNIDPQDFNKK